LWTAGEGLKLEKLEKLEKEGWRGRERCGGVPLEKARRERLAQQPSCY